MAQRIQPMCGERRDFPEDPDVAVRLEAIAAAEDEKPTLEEAQKGATSFPEVPSDDFFPKGRTDAPWAQNSFTKSLQKAEILLRNRLNPSLKWMLKQKLGDSGWDVENDQTFAACPNLTSCSSHHLHHVEQSVLRLGEQCQVLLDTSPGTTRGCFRYSSLNGEFYHHGLAASLNHHYVQLCGLFEERAWLLLTHEYTRHSQAATSFIRSITKLLQEDQFFFPDQSTGEERSSIHLGFQSLCLDLKVHVNHWNLLSMKVRNDRWLRSSFSWRTSVFLNMKQTLKQLALQAVILVERYLRKLLYIISLANFSQISGEVLADLLEGLKIYNHILVEHKPFLLGQVGSVVSFLDETCLPKPFPVAQVLGFLSEHIGWMAAGQLHQWVASQSCFMTSTCHYIPWNDVTASILQPTLPTRSHQHFSANPLLTFIDQNKIFKERLLETLISYADLHVPNRPKLDQETSTNYSGGCPKNVDSKFKVAETECGEPKRCKTVQWDDIGRVDVCKGLLTEYEQTLWREFWKALQVLFYNPRCNVLIGSLNQCGDQVVFQVLKELCRYRTEVIPPECDRAISSLCTEILAKTAYMQWDEAMCASLGMGTKDKCLPQPRPKAWTSTTDLLLQLFPPLHTMLSCLENLKATLGCGFMDGDTRTLRSLQLGLLSRSLATVHWCVYWIMSRSHQFLASWSLNKFLLLTQGDLKVLKMAIDGLLLKVDVALVDRGENFPAKLELDPLQQAACDLQVFSEGVLKTFAKDCKKMAAEIFEQTMPSGKHWRVNYRAELPRSPSEYATFAAHSVIAQVLEAVQPMSDEDRFPALTEAVTAFMEAWMEHILRQKIKFSIQGALQLKQDFDLIRSLLRAEEYRLSEQIHQQLLSLHVFQQVDSAIVCLLQQPVTKQTAAARGWEPFRRCCPNGGGHAVEQLEGSLNSLESMDIQAARNQALIEAGGSLGPHPPAGSPPQSYLAVTQQEWLALRCHAGTRWKLPGLQCMNKPEQ